VNDDRPPAAASAGDGPGEGPAWLDRVGVLPGHLLQEFGWDEDCDEDVRVALEDRAGSSLEDEDYTGVADVVLQWWRGDEGDLTDALVDDVVALDTGGFVLLLTPRPGRGAEVEEADIHEAATTAGLHASTSTACGPDWRLVKLDAPKSARAAARHE